MPLDALIKFRCEQSLEDRLLRIAAKERRELANLLRIALEDYAAEQERKLGLADILRDAPSPGEHAASVTLQHAAAAAQGKPVSYRAGKGKRAKSVQSPQS